MHGVKSEASPTEGDSLARPRNNKLHRRFPAVEYLRRRARKRLPKFAFEYADGGAAADTGITRNWDALDSIEIIPRYGLVTGLPPIETKLFGRSYSAPFGIAPMGGPSLVWPGADEYLARAAQAARVPYTLGTVGGMSIERGAEIAPDVLWFQLYRLARNDHFLGFDLVRRAEAAGVHVLMLTLDVPVRTTRPREVASGITSPFRPDIRMLAGIMTSPGWLASMLRNGVPRFSTLASYVGSNASVDDVAAFVKRENRGAFTWEEVARYRDRWKRPLVVKGIMHPEDAEKAIRLGVDGILVSNHGGRQVKSLPAAIDVLPAIAEQVGSRATVLMDSGIRSGSDVVCAGALGASATLVGKAFLWALGALGQAGPAHLIDLLTDEIKAAIGQAGATSIEETRDLLIRHAGRVRF